jgi:protein phosphatase
MTSLRVPELSLVVLIGPSGSGKSTFAAEHFAPHEVLSSDFCRGLVGDDENDQAVTADAFDVLHYIAGKRLALGRLTVVDATNVQPSARAPLIALAREHHVIPVAIVLDIPEEICIRRTKARPDRPFGANVIRRQRRALGRPPGRLEKEGFRRVYVLRGVEEVATAHIAREPAWSDRSDERGPFDIIGDVHGCSRELTELLTTLGYEPGPGGVFRHPRGRTAVFLGDLVDRGPDAPGVLRTVMEMVESGAALCVPGNHENKLLRALRGRKVQVSHGLSETLAQLDRSPPELRARIPPFLDGLVSHLVLDDRRLVVAHAGMRQEMQGRASAAVRAFALYGETTGETDEFGLPVRYPWAEDYRGSALVVYGHTPIPEPVWVNNTICVDTGCVFGGRLTALRYPERELVSVQAHRTYYEPVRPLASEADTDGPRTGMLDLDDVLGKRIVETRLHGRVTIPQDNAAAALEVMSRFAIDPRWLIYLPPTMAPTATSERADLLEGPTEAFRAFAREGAAAVICEEKHMGSRAIAIVCRDEAPAARRFNGTEGRGAVYTRTGRAFFADPDLETAFLARLGDAMERAGLWAELDTDWLALDGEVLPWSLKADGLLRTHYGADGAAATAGLRASVSELERAVARGVPVAAIAGREAERLSMAHAFVDAYRPYRWEVRSLSDVQFAPFVVLAGEAATYLDREHVWHLGIAERLADAAGGMIRPTSHRIVAIDDPAEQRAGDRWWTDLTESGGEGMVVKPLVPVSSGARGLRQPGLKVRGREYLRIIYGPEYTAADNIRRLRDRHLGRKQSLALREFALGVESLERFVRGEPPHRVHECVFGVLALESEPVDPRL